MTPNESHLSERFRRLSKEGLWIVTGQVATIAGSLVGVRILTGLMTSRQYGELALGMTIATLVNQVILGPLGNGAPLAANRLLNYFNQRKF
jgi:O-antigen/teichoic acid export membrane protein